MRKILGGMGGILLSVVFFFGGLSCEKSPIIIGFIGPLFGKYSDLGVQGRNGVMLAVEELNAQGGISGRKVKLVAENDGGTPEGALAAVKKLKDLSAAAIIGPMLSTEAMAIKPFIDFNNIVVISPVVSTSRLSNEKDYFFRVITDNVTRGSGLGRFALSLMPPSKSPRLWCSVSDYGNIEYSSDLVSNFFNEIGKSGDITACQIAYISDRGYIPDNVFEQVKAVRPDAVLLVTSSFDAAQFVNWAQDKLSGVPLFIGAWAATKVFLERIRSEDLHIFFEHIEPPQPNNDLQRFKRSYYEKFGTDAGFPAVFAYEAFGVVAEALKMTDGEGGERLREALARVKDFKGLVSYISLNDEGDADRPWWIYTVKDGAFVVVKSFNGFEK